MGVRHLLDEDAARERLAYWQDLLRLRDWTITVEIVRERDMWLDGLAYYSSSLNKKQAAIKLLNPVDFDPTWFGERDMELSLVHELIHLHLEPFDPEGEDGGPDHGLAGIALEQAVHSLSLALVDLERSQRRNGG